MEICHLYCKMLSFPVFRCKQLCVSFTRLFFKLHFWSTKPSTEIRQECNLHGDLFPYSVEVLCNGTLRSGRTPFVFHQTEFTLYTSASDTVEIGKCNWITVLKASRVQSIAVLLDLHMRFSFYMNSKFFHFKAMSYAPIVL